MPEPMLSACRWMVAVRRALEPISPLRVRRRVDRHQAQLATVLSTSAEDCEALAERGQASPDQLRP